MVVEMKIRMAKGITFIVRYGNTIVKLVIYYAELIKSSVLIGTNVPLGF